MEDDLPFQLHDFQVPCQFSGGGGYTPSYMRILNKPIIIYTDPY